jgi:hypothetical protein
MPNQEISFVLKAVNGVSGELAKVQADLAKIAAASRSTRGEIVAYGNAWGTAGKDITKGTDDATGKLSTLDHVARSAAHGGIKELASQIPVVGNSLSKLAEGFSGVELAQAGIAGAGVALITYLKSLDEQAAKTLAGISKLSQGIGDDFAISVQQVKKITADATEDRLGSIEAGYQAERAAAAKTRHERDADAAEELRQNSGFWAEMTGAAAMARQKYRVEQAAADAAQHEADTQAEAKHQADLIALARERLAQTKALYADLSASQAQAQADTLNAEGKRTEALAVSLDAQKALYQKAYEERLDQIQKEGYGAAEADKQREAAYQILQNNLTSLETKGAEERRSIIEKSTGDALAIYQRLGAGFEDITRKLSVASFVQNTSRAIDSLKALGDAIASGDKTLQDAGLTQKDVAAGIRELTDQMKDAVTHGMVPMTDAAKETAKALDTVGTSATAAADGAAALFNAGAAAPAVLSTLDALIAKGKAVQDAFAAAGRSMATFVPGASIPGAPGGAPASAAGAGAPMRPTGNLILDRDPSLPTGTADYLYGPLSPLTGGQSRHGYDVGAIPIGPRGSGGMNTAPLAEPYSVTPTSADNFGPRESSFPSTTYTQTGTRVPSFATGGVIPGAGPVPVTAHGEEVIGPPKTIVAALAGALREVAGPRTVVNFSEGAIRQSGTVISQERDWSSLVDMLATSIAARQR